MQLCLTSHFIVTNSKHIMHHEEVWPRSNLQSDGSGRVPSLHIPHELSQFLSGKYFLGYVNYFRHRELTVPLPALSHSSRHIFCHVDVAPLDRLEFFRCESYHSFCTLSIPAFLRTSSLSLNSSKQTKTGLGNKRHEHWMTSQLNVRKLELYLKEQWFFVETRCTAQ